MDALCDFEVDVNGEAIFLVDKKIISSYCGSMSKLFGKSKGISRNLKVIFHDFPGGAEGFELMSRFCYNNGKIEINPYNATLLYCISNYMEMNKTISKTQNLFEQTETYLKEIKFWTWSELVLALKHSQDLLLVENSPDVVHKFIDCLAGKIYVAGETSPCPYSPESSAYRLSTDTKSTESIRSGLFRATWWFEDFVALNPDLIQISIKSMLFQKIHHWVISRFLFYYQKARFLFVKSVEKVKIVETVIDMLCFLDQSSVSCKSLFGILRVCLNLKIRKEIRVKLEKMIGLQLDQSNLDDLLVPSPYRMNCLYDVNLILRFLKFFLDDEKKKLPLDQLKKVGKLIELYIMEVAPDPCLKPLKFLALIRAVQDLAYDTCDGIYHAIDMYLEVHSGLSEEEKRRVCCGINYSKLTFEARNHLAKNPNFPSKSALQALDLQENHKFKNLLEDPNETKQITTKSLLSSVGEPKKGKKDKGSQQIVLYSQKLDRSTENEKLKENLQGMQWRVVELEKVCKKMQNQLTKMMNSRVRNQTSARSSLPRLCS